MNDEFYSLTEKWKNILTSLHGFGEHHEKNSPNLSFSSYFWESDSMILNLFLEFDFDICILRSDWVENVLKFISFCCKKARVL